MGFPRIKSVGDLVVLLVVWGVVPFTFFRDEVHRFLDYHDDSKVANFVYDAMLGLQYVLLYLLDYFEPVSVSIVSYILKKVIKSALSKG